ncbi:MAG TPA: DUF4892 domain-containing protein [Marinagarivorans sp.]
MRLLPVVFVFGIMLACVKSYAQENTALIASLVPTNHRLVFDERQNNAVMQWLVSSIKKVNGRWRYDESAEISGRLLKQTYEFYEVDRDALAASLERLADDESWRVIFNCEGFTCGRSYGWAEVLENKMLHGTDSTQQYWVWQGDGVWYSAFLIERRNRRVYLQWLELTVEDKQPLDANAKNIMSVWDTQGFAVLPVRPSADASPTRVVREENPSPLVGDADFALLVQWLGALEARNFAVVGHNQVKGQADQESKSLRDAQALQRALKKVFAEHRFTSFGLGPIVPRGDWAERIEVVPLER